MIIHTEPLSEAGFAPFGDVLSFERGRNFPINDGNCQRFHDLGRVDVREAGEPAMSLGRAQPYSLPFTMKLMERHPLGSQAWIPLSKGEFLVMVAPDNNGTPGSPRAFLAAFGVGVNYHINVWHVPITPLDVPMDFLIVDRAGPGDNLEEYHFMAPYRVLKS